MGRSNRLPVKGVAVALVVHRHKVHQHYVVGLRVQAVQAHLERGKHAAPRLRHDHLGALLMELVPQRLRLEDDARCGQGGM